MNITVGDIIVFYIMFGCIITVVQMMRDKKWLLKTYNGPGEFVLGMAFMALLWPFWVPQEVWPHGDD